MNPPDWSDLVKVHLFYGRDRAVTLGQLQEQLGTSRRQVERAIEALVLGGAPVVTGGDGAYLSTDARELAEAAKALQARAVTILRRARALRATARRHGAQQMEMFG